MLPGPELAPGAFLLPLSLNSEKYSGNLRVLTELGACTCPLDRCWMFGSIPGVPGARGMPGLLCVAATSRGLTP